TTADGIAVSGIAGDQQAALFGQACFEPGMAKNTYGTGSFVLMNVGARHPEPVEGLLTTVGWELADGTLAYVLEGALFVTGAAVQETTALGAAYLAGLAAGVWSTLDEVAHHWKLDAEFTPAVPASVADARHAGWRRAVERSRGWVA